MVGYEDLHTVPARPIGTTLHPTLFPRKLFHEACALAPTFNKLYASISEDEEWLHTTLKDLIHGDELVGILWDIYKSAKRDGSTQLCVLGVFRSDYMMHASSGQHMSTAQLKQVEFNAYSCAGGAHGNIVADMHRHLAQKGVYGSCSHYLPHMPRNTTIAGITNALMEGHKLYKGMTKTQAQTCVLFVVQPFNVNICDERPLEYALWDVDIPAYRVEFGDEVLTSCRLGGNGELLFVPPNQLGATEHEVAVVYMRAGYDIEEFDDAGRSARLMLEKSRSIKCPSIACHLATLKKVQQALTEPGALTRFLSPDEAADVERAFMPIYPLDQSENGLRARDLAANPGTAVQYVLKPSLEGGGNNIYREAIPGFLNRLPQDKIKEYILMELITPPELENTLISSTGQYHGQVVSELGVFGTCIWRRNGETTQVADSVRSCYITIDYDKGCAGWSLKTKAKNVDEMSVVKGYGCFDSLLLSDGDSGVWDAP